MTCARRSSKDAYYQTWSALRRMTMEQRQQAGRWVAVRQAEDLAAKVDRIVANDAGFEPDPTVKVPRYVAAVDHHCMPGSYHTEMFPGDVSAAANYDSGIFATTGGTLGRYTDGGGKAVLRWLERNLPGFRPRTILDIGSTLGHSIVPIAAAFPDAQVTAVDVSKPVLRYALARARSLGVENLRFVQADGADLRRFSRRILRLGPDHDVSARALPWVDAGDHARELPTAEAGRCGTASGAAAIRS